MDKVSHHHNLTLMPQLLVIDSGPFYDRKRPQRSLSNHLSPCSLAILVKMNIHRIFNVQRMLLASA